MENILTSKGRVAALGVVTTILILVVAWLTLVHPRLNTLAQVKSQVSSQNQSNQHLAVQLTTLKHEAANLSAAKQSVAAFEAKFPPSANEDTLFASIEQMAAQSGAAITTISPSLPNVGLQQAAVSGGGGGGNPIGVLPLKLNATGSGPQIQRLLDLIESTNRAIVVQHVSVSGNGANVDQASIEAIGYLSETLKAPTSR